MLEQPNQRTALNRLIDGYVGFALGRATAPKPTVTEVQVPVAVPVHVPVHIEPSDWELVLKAPPALSLFAVTIVHMSAIADQIATSEGVTLTRSDQAQRLKYMAKARGRIGNALEAMLRDLNCGKDLAPILELMETMFAVLKHSVQKP